ncbi:myb-like DNA-binding domain-containing protein [Coniochaeta sp. 2T2.1]|nr:myb-like DNA-binding domain-containing protein [Coniochaeta sp. 2T2.1]
MPQSHASDSPAKKQSKWSAEEDALIIELRGSGMKWDDISKRLPGRSPISCRLHYQNYLEKRSEWDEERKNKLARLYERFKPEMWAKVAEEMQVPWRAAEAMHWQLGEADMARRAGVTPFSLQAPGPEGPQQPHHRTSPSRGHGYSQSHSSVPSHGMLSPRYGRTPVPGSISGHGYPGPPPSHGYGLVPPPLHATIPPPVSGGGPLAPHRESMPPRHHQYHHLQPPSPKDQYGTHPGPGLPPLQPGPPGQGRGGLLPSVAELTTGISPYNTPAYSLSVPSGSPVASGTTTPGLGGSGHGHTLAPLSSYRHTSPLPPPHHYQQQQQQQYHQQQPQQQQHYEPGPSSSTAAGKRRASPEVMARETSRRRHLDPQPRHQQEYEQQYDDGDSSGSHRTR